MTARGAGANQQGAGSMGTLAGSGPGVGGTARWWGRRQWRDWPKYFALGTDHTHPNPTGAGIVSGFVRDAVAEQKLKLGDYLR